MNLLIAALCDAATDYAGKLNILGTFDTIFSRDLPVEHPSCAVAMRMVFNKIEEGQHHVRTEVVNADGKPVGPPMEVTLDIEVPDEIESLSRNLIINIQHWRFEHAGQYAVNIAIDGRHEASIPLRVTLLRPPAEGEE
ncbi:MAG: hypothetical protein SNJ52_02725 [Verrucomicrobiia bacterium]